MNARIQSVNKAHQDTFGWIFDNPDLGFTNWLRDEDGIFWITGKPGSGKSTLMKLLLNDPRTMAALPADKGRSNVVAFFFHDQRGTPLLKTRRGLFQSLLFQMLDASKRLTRDALPELWSQKEARSQGEPLSQSFQEPVPMQQLEDGFRYLAKQRVVSLNCCFLLDGLDEFEGDPYENLATLKEFLDLARPFHSIHMCLASRPLPPFKHFLSSYRRLHVQTLTAECIKKYTCSTFLERGPTQAQSLIEKEDIDYLAMLIQEMSHGVFLWVKIATANLVSGMLKYENGLELETRLRAMPDDLFGLYEHLLSSIDMVHWEQAAKTILLVRHHSGLTPLGLVFALEEPPSDIDQPCVDIDTEDLLQKRDLMIRRVETRLGGLVELEGKRSFLPRGFQFLHATVREFIETPAMAQWLSNSLGRVAFDVHATSMKSILGEMRLVGFNSNWGSWINTGLDENPGLHPPDVQQEHGWLLWQFSMCAERAEKEAPNTYHYYLDALDSLCSRQYEMYRQQDSALVLKDMERSWEQQAGRQKNWISYVSYVDARRTLNIGKGDPSDWDTDFESWALRHGLMRYVDTRIKRGYCYLDKTGRPFLSYASDPEGAEEGTTSTSRIRPRADHVERLLKAGCNPNEEPRLVMRFEVDAGDRRIKVDGHRLEPLTPWHAFLCAFSDHVTGFNFKQLPQEIKVAIAKEYTDTMRRFVLAGADLSQAAHLAPWRILTPLEILRKGLKDIDGVELRDMEQLLFSRLRRPSDQSAETPLYQHNDRDNSALDDLQVGRPVHWPKKFRLVAFMKHVVNKR